MEEEIQKTDEEDSAEPPVTGKKSQKLTNPPSSSHGIEQPTRGAKQRLGKWILLGRATFANSFLDLLMEALKSKFLASPELHQALNEG